MTSCPPGRSVSIEALERAARMLEVMDHAQGEAEVEGLAFLDVVDTLPAHLDPRKRGEYFPR
jgi:hypothetical protein